MPERYREPSPDELRALLSERQARLADIQERGADALSRYDVEICHRGDAERAVWTATWLLGNQINYYTTALEPFQGQPQQTSFLDDIVPQETDH